MFRDRLFDRTRLQIAGWYAGVMSGLLALTGLGIYYTVAQSYQKTIDRGLEAGLFHCQQRKIRLRLTQ